MVLFHNKKILALIPARGGSKGVLEKNIKPLCGIPLIAHTLRSAKESNLFERIIVSTDSERICKVALDYGGEVPFMRPVHLATDSARGMDVIIHAMEWLEERGDDFDYVVLLQPTSPLRGVEDIAQAMNLCLEKDANAVVSVVECEHHPLWANVLQSDLTMGGFIRPDICNKNRQELPKYYRLNGAIFASKWDYIKSAKMWFSNKTFAHVMPKERSVDIDNIFDFRVAELLLSEKNMNGDKCPC